MSRSNYSNDLDTWDLIRWRGAVESAVRGKRGQAFLKELLAALDAMPDKKLAKESLVTVDGEYCTLGALGAARGIDMADIDPDDSRSVAGIFGVATALAKEIVFENDENGPYLPETPAERWARMRKWVSDQLRERKPK